MNKETSYAKRKLLDLTSETGSTNIEDSMLALEALLQIKIKDPTAKNGDSCVSRPNASQGPTTAAVLDFAARPRSSPQDHMCLQPVLRIALPQAPRNLVAHKSNRSEVRPTSSPHVEQSSHTNPHELAVPLNGYTRPPVVCVQQQDGNATMRGATFTQQPQFFANLYQPAFARSGPAKKTAYTLLAESPRPGPQHLLPPPGLIQVSSSRAPPQAQSFSQAHSPHKASKAPPATNQPIQFKKLATTGTKSNTNGKPNVSSAPTGSDFSSAPPSSADEHSSSSTPPGSHSNGASLIRPSQVEAALRSKPQRGKKRDNLSLSERLELTRTRNREHAKSTRIRKKARFEELCYRESEWHTYYNRELLDKARRQCLVDFMRFRSSAIKADSKFWSPDEADDGGRASSLRSDRPKEKFGCKDCPDFSLDGTVKICNSAGGPEVSPASQKKPGTAIGGGDTQGTIVDWANFFHHGEEYRLPESYAPSLQPYQSADSESTNWEMFVQDPSSFLFSSHSSLSGCAPHRNESTGMERLSRVESTLTSCIGTQFRYEGRRILALWIEVLDGTDGVALVKDVALFQFQLIVIYEEGSGQQERAASLADNTEESSRAQPKSCVAASGVLRAVFASSSKKMSSLEICSCDTPFGQPLKARSLLDNSTGHNPSHSVAAWPSVVSLDQQHHDSNFEGNKGKSSPG